MENALMIRLNPFKYKNIDCANNVIRYITRTRENETRQKELVSYGSHIGNVYHKPIEQFIREFEFVQDYLRGTGSLLCHYSIQISDLVFARMNNDMNLLNCYARDCCKYIFDFGYQAAYAIHYSEKDRLHIHLAINTISYTKKGKLRQHPQEIKRTIEMPLNDILHRYIRNVSTFDTLHDLSQN